jgi:uncharacterized protein
MKRRFYLAAACVLLLATPASSDDLPNLDEAFDKGVLVIETASDGCFKFDVYLALTRSQQQRGLMFVRHLPPWTGMLFLYDRASIRSMWMKNTYISLDMVFARHDGTVSSIARNTEPLSLRSIASVEPVKFVLELNAGTSERLSIDENSRLIWEPAQSDDE